MAQHIALHDLVGAVAGSIVDAQAQVERHFIHQVSGYFDSDGKPLCLAIKLPKAGSAGSTADADYNQLGVPLLSLVESSMLSIQDLRIDLDVELGTIVSDADDEAMAAPAPLPQAPIPPAANRAPHAFTSSGAPIDVPDTQAQPALDPAPAQAAPRADLPRRDAAPQPAGLSKMLTLGIGSRQDSGPRARLTINVAASRPTEGMLRLITQLNKLV